MRESQSISVCGDRCSASPRSSRRNTAFSAHARCPVAPRLRPPTIRLLPALRVHPYLSTIFLCLRPARSRLLRRLNFSRHPGELTILTQSVTSRPHAIDIQIPVPLHTVHSATCYSVYHPLRPISSVACAAPSAHLAHRSSVKQRALNLLQFDVSPSVSEPRYQPPAVRSIDSARRSNYRLISSSH